MPTLTQDYRDTIKARLVRDPAFREALLEEGEACLSAGDHDMGRVILGDYLDLGMKNEK